MLRSQSSPSASSVSSVSFDSMSTPHVAVSGRRSPLAVTLAVALLGCTFVAVTTLAGCGGGGGNSNGASQFLPTPFPSESANATPTQLPSAPPSASPTPLTLPAASSTPTPIPIATPIPAPASTPVVVAVTPANTTLSIGDSTTFAANVTGTVNTGVTWTVQEADGGTITSSGVYNAPGTPGTFHILAVSTVNGSSTGEATIIVQSGNISGTVK